MSSPVNSGLVRNLTPFFWRKNSAALALAMANSIYMSLPNLRAFWPGSVLGTAGVVRDLSGNGLVGTKSGISNPKTVASSSIIVPYMEFDGTDYYTVSDEARLDISGTEAYISPAGLTLGAWIYADTLAANRGIIAKGSSTDAAYRLYVDTSGQAVFGVATNSTTYKNVGNYTASAATWHFVAGRFTASTEMTTYLDDDYITNTSSVPSSVRNSASDLRLGAEEYSSMVMDGRIAFAWICACALPDDWLFYLYEMTRPMFGK